MHQVEGYVVERLLGRGAMGEVHLARGVDDGAPVVIKFIAAAVHEPQLLRRFEREGAALRALPPHPCLVRVLDAPGPPRPCLVLEYVEGVTLLRRLQEHGPLPPLEAARVARDVARALEVVHAHGLLHRDLKPANLMLTPAGQVKVVDFGLVKDVFATALTLPGQLLGTGPYVPPELWAGEPADEPACDVWALGATLFHLVAGRPPFDAPDLEALADLVQSGPPPLLRAAAPDAPEELERVVLQMLAPERRHRYARMGDCVDDLERVLHGQPCEAPALLGPGGRRAPLLPGARFVLGAAPSCEVRLDDASVAPAHAQVRRLPDGWELRDLRSPAGTFVGPARVEGAARLSDGDVVRLGATSLTFVDPRARPRAAAFLHDVARAPLVEPALEVLAELGDARAALHLLEQLAPDPLGRARAARALAALGSGVDAVLARRAALEARRAAVAARRLATVAGRPDQAAAGPEAWLAWWDAARSRAPGQLEPPRARPALRLRVVRGDAAEDLALGDDPLLLVGRDARCHVRLDDPTVSRLHATLLRAHTRLLVRDEGRAAGTLRNGTPVRVAFFDPDDVLLLGDVELRLLPPAARDESPEGELDPLTLAALAEPAAPSSPARAALLRHALAATDGPPPREGARLFPGDVVRAAHVDAAVTSLVAGRRRSWHGALAQEAP